MILLLLLLTYSTTKHQMSKSNLQFAYVICQTYPLGGKIHENLSVHLRYLRILQLTLGDS